MRELEHLIQSWDGIGVLTRYDEPTGTWIFICIHDNSLGAATGGTRIRTYPTPADALRDGMRLAEGMTHKWAAVDLGFGGAKAVLAVPGPIAGDERRGLLQRYAGLIEILGGSFLTGEDMGITSEDMEFISRHTSYLHGFDEHGKKVDPSPFTARGVVTGIKASLAHRYGDDSISGKRVLVQGTGNVGGHLVRMLAEEGAEILVEDIDRDRAQSLADEVGARVIDNGDTYSTECDVFAPCAIGAILNQDTIPKLACPIVAGSANNQLAEHDDVERLRERGILYAPDYIVNAGGAISFAHIGRGITARDRLFEKVDSIGSTLAEILAEADERGESSLDAADRRVARVLARARA
ncbi:MAG: Glu/Leu/Phe/Val dehydrogenase dimerization domain-containing protein [Thermoanaerobaculia bacterium]